VAQINGKTEQVKPGHMLAMNGDLKLAKFDKDDVDDLYRWSHRRSEYISMANVSAAKSVADSGSYWGMSSWYYNPYYSMFTFIPSMGAYYNPFGYMFWSPYTVYGYLNSPIFAGGYGYGGGGGYYRVPGRTGQKPGLTGVSRGIPAAATAARMAAVTRSAHASGQVGASGWSGGSRGSSTASSSSVAHSSSISTSSMSTGHVGGGSHK